MRIGRQRQRVGGFALAGLQPHDTRRNIAVFDRRNARDDFDRFDVGRSDVAGAGTFQISQRSIGRKAYSIDLDRRAERCVADRRTAVAQREPRVVHQVGIDGLAARQQGRNIRCVDHLEVVDGIAADRARGRHGVGYLAGRYDNIFQRQVVFGQIDVE